MKLTPKEEAERLICIFTHSAIKLFTKISVKQIAIDHALICTEEKIEIFNDTNGSDYREDFFKQVKEELLKM